MERRMRYLWWGVLGIVVLFAGWKLFLRPGTTATVEKASNNREIVVYVSGAVSKPGLISLPLDARLNDVLKEANPLPEADLEQLNPASKLKDGQKISIPYKAGMKSAETAAQAAQAPQMAQTSQGSLSGQAAQVAQSPQTSSVSGSAPSSNTGKININTAGAAELDNLPGVGPALAARIIQYRTDNGPFTNPEDLQNVSGIGSKTYEKMASMVTTGP